MRKKGSQKRKSVVFLVALLAAVLIWGTGLQPVYAKTHTGVPASSLAVFLNEDGKTTLLHDYTIEEMTGLIDSRNVRYSSIDAMPARVLTVGSGVSLSTLISDLDRYTDADLTNFKILKLTATDGWTRTYTKSNLDETKYYYKNLFSTNTWDGAAGKAGAPASGGAVPVKPMLAVTSWQGRVMKNTGDVSPLIGEMSGETVFRLCLGMSPEDLASGNSTTSEYGKWINQIELVPGSQEQNSSSSWQNSFRDVKEKDWFYGAVGFASVNGLFQGTGTNAFNPVGTMTRAMFVTVLGRLAKADPTAYQNEFKDVSKGRYYEGYVAWAAENGIISGSGGGSFRPDDRITREQMALMIYQYAMSAGIDGKNTDPAKCLSYSDYEAIMDPAKEAVCWAVNSGIIAGSGGKLDPKGAATRAQVAQIMKNFAEAENLM